MDDAKILSDAIKRLNARMTEAKILSDAIKRLNIKMSEATKIFRVSRQSVSSWINGRAKIPPRAFVRIVEYENELFAAEYRKSQLAQLAQLSKIAANLNKKR